MPYRLCFKVYNYKELGCGLCLACCRSGVVVRIINQGAVADSAKIELSLPCQIVNDRKNKYFLAQLKRQQQQTFPGPPGAELAISAWRAD